jgi:hypothetical protein
MNAARRRIWWSSCPTSPHRANGSDNPAETAPKNSPSSKTQPPFPLGFIALLYVVSFAHQPAQDRVAFLSKAFDLQVAKLKVFKRLSEKPP